MLPVAGRPVLLAPWGPVRFQRRVKGLRCFKTSVKTTTAVNRDCF